MRVGGSAATDPPRRVAFLRGINLGSRRIKMDVLRRHFEDLGVENVATFLASGNVVFDPDPSDHATSGAGSPETLEVHESADALAAADALEKRIEVHLADALGFEVDAHVRPLAALESLTTLGTVVAARDEGFNPHVIFLRSEPGAEVEEALRALETPDDRFEVVGRQAIWMRRGGLTDSSIETRHLEKALGGMDNTMRNLNTLRRIVAKFGG